MAMGHNAAFNIHQQMLESQFGHTPGFMEFPEVPPMISLAVGKKAILYSPSEGTQSGAEVMKNFFGDDLGLKSIMIARKRSRRDGVNCKIQGIRKSSQKGVSESK
jgi:hypothetical protein